MNLWRWQLLALAQIAHFVPRHVLRPFLVKPSDWQRSTEGF